MPILISYIQTLQNITPVVPVKATGHEATAWKKLLPAYVERCTTWVHKSNCEYKSYGKIPLSVKLDENSICACGEGLGFSSAEWNVPCWKGLLRYATRAAISPLFSVSYIESVAGIARQPPSSAITSASSSAVAVKEPDACLSCGGPGKPTLLTCGKCKKARYCSSACQHRDWKSHKVSCKAA